MSTKPRRGTQQVWYDTFMDWSLDDQAAAIKMLNELHRQKARMTGPVSDKEPKNHFVAEKGESS